MQLTYPEALASSIEHTEIGYTIRSQDRLWIVFSYDLWSEGEMRYNRLYPMAVADDFSGVISGTAYDRDMHGGGDVAVPVWTTRAEAEFFAENWRNLIDRWFDSIDSSNEKPEVYVMNLGDDARFEAQIIGLDNGRSVRDKPKFKGSEAAWAAMAQMHMRAVQWYAELEAAKQEDEKPSCP